MSVSRAHPELPRKPVALAVRILLVRLRFLAVPLVAFLLVAFWPVLRNLSETLTRHRHDPAAEAISQNTEYFCPMCPGVVSDWPGKCPVCNMALVRRQRGEAVALPNGVVARMQLSPYRVQLAGIQTTEIAYRPLVREVEASGFVEAGGTGGADRVCVRAEVFSRDLPLLPKGAEAKVTCDAFPGRDPFPGKVRQVGAEFAGGRAVLRAVIDLDNPGQELRPGMFVHVRVRLPV
jgi:hypothetical protein